MQKKVTAHITVKGVGTQSVTVPAGTYSATITMSPEEREQELARVRLAAESVVSDGSVEIPMSCRCWRAVRS